jgi:hypothetical protein
MTPFRLGRWLAWALLAAVWLSLVLGLAWAVWRSPANNPGA